MSDIFISTGDNSSYFETEFRDYAILKMIKIILRLIK